MAMVRVFAEADVGNHKKFQFCFANRFNGALDHTLSAEELVPRGSLDSGNPNKIIPGIPATQLHELLPRSDRPTADTHRHGADFLAHLCTRHTNIG